MSEQSLDLSLTAPVKRAWPRIKGLWVLFGLVAIMALMPLIASPYALLLLVPFIGYAIALFGFQPAVRHNGPAVVRSRAIPRCRRLYGLDVDVQVRDLEF